jgi:hypothetical protein
LETIYPVLLEKYHVDLSDKNAVTMAIYDNLYEFELQIGEAAKSIGLMSHLDDINVGLEYLTQSLNRLKAIFNYTSIKYGFAEDDIEVEICWIPDADEKMPVIEDTLGESHISVSYKGVYLFGFSFKPLGNLFTWNVSENIEDIFDKTVFGYQSNPFILFKTYEDVVKFADDYFKTAKIRKYYEKEMKRRKETTLDLWVGPQTYTAQKVVVDKIKPELEGEGFTSYFKGNGELHFLISEIDMRKAKDIVEKNSKKGNRLFWNFQEASKLSLPID